MKSVMIVSTVLIVVVFSLCSVLTGCGSVHKKVGDDGEIRLSEDVIVAEIAPGYWFYSTYVVIEPYGYVGANGLLVIDGQDAAMIDLPWTDEQAGILFDWVEEKHNAKIQVVVPTHSHADCAGGLDEAHRRGATSIALNKTIEIMTQKNLPVAKNGFVDNTSVSFGDVNIELSYLGAGHTIDNIVAWMPNQKLLFAGCLVKGINFETIGNTSEADLENYPETLRKMKDSYDDAVIVVPGHGKPGGLEMIDHTQKLLEKYMEEIVEQENPADGKIRR